MLPANSISCAASRWLRILRTSTLSQAWSLIQADSAYTDLPKTQYASALDWLKALRLVIEGPDGLEIAAAAKLLPLPQVNQLLFERSLEQAAPDWRLDSDIWIPDASEVPQDAGALAETLELSDDVALLVIRHVHGRINLEQRNQIGLAGERALIGVLEARWPGSTTQVSQIADGYGYDIAFRHGGAEWHLEVKSTARRGRLLMYLSRHEYEVGLRDPIWRLIVVGLSSQLQLQSMATAQLRAITDRAPGDRHVNAKWQSAAYELTANDLEDGLSFLGLPPAIPGYFADRPKPRVKLTNERGSEERLVTR